MMKLAVAVAVERVYAINFLFLLLLLYYFLIYILFCFLHLFTSKIKRINGTYIDVCGAMLARAGASARARARISSQQ